MANPWVYEVFRFEDLHGAPVTVGVDYGAVTLRAHDAVLDAVKLNILQAWIGVALQQAQQDEIQLEEAEK